MAEPEEAATVVMLLSRHPHAEHSGRAVMLRQRLRQLRSAYRVHVIAFGHPAGGELDDGIEFLPMASPLERVLNAARLAGAPLQTWLYFSARARRRIAEVCAATNARAIYVDMLRLAPLAASPPRRTALVLDFDDLLSRRYDAAGGARGYDPVGFLGSRHRGLAAVARLLAGPLLRMEARRCGRYEKELLQHVDAAIFTSPQEAEEARARVPDSRGKIVAAPPTVTPRRLVERASAERLIFLGNLHYSENVQALRALARGAAELEAEGQLPAGTVVDVVGAYGERLPEEFDSRRFKFLGRLPDLSVLAGQGVFLAPIAGGSGVKLKILEGMSLGCPVVTTPKGCEGLTARPNRDLIVAPDARSVLTSALALQSRPRLLRMLRKRGIRYLERAHSLRIDGVVTQAVATAIDDAARARPGDPAGAPL